MPNAKVVPDVDPNCITRDQWHTVDQTRSTPDLTPAPKVHLVYLRLPSAQSCCGAALGGSHPCAQDEPEPGAPRERRRFPHNSAELLTRDTGGLVIGQSESGRRAARYKLTHQDWPIGSGARTKWFLGVTFREGRFSFPMRLAQRIEAFGVLSHKRTFSLPT